VGAIQKAKEESKRMTVALWSCGPSYMQQRIKKKAKKEKKKDNYRCKPWRTSG
jgi:hypothetical protein